MQDALASAVQKCPFLHQLAARHGDSFARCIAVDPSKPVGSSGPRPLLEEMHNFESTLRIFHGPSGVVPLARFSTLEPEQNLCKKQEAAPSVMHSQGSTAPSPSLPTSGVLPKPSLRHPLSATPMASIGLSFRMPGPDDFHRRNPSGNRKPSSSRSRWRAAAAGAHAAGAAAAAGKCPLRGWLGPLAPLVFNKFDKLACPEPIMAMRAALSQSTAVRTLRPQAVPTKIAAIAAMAAILNIPFGAVREHCEKFSLSWILVVHATIPFIAMMRKAVVMPKYAIVFTIAAAIAGQAVGARLERIRIAEGRPPVLVHDEGAQQRTPEAPSGQCPAVQLAASMASKMPEPTVPNGQSNVAWCGAPLAMNLATLRPPGMVH